MVLVLPVEGVQGHHELALGVGHGHDGLLNIGQEPHHQQLGQVAGFSQLDLVVVGSRLNFLLPVPVLYVPGVSDVGQTD